MDKDTLLIIPAYNEEMNIEHVLRDVLASDIAEEFDVVVVNDGSSDDTEAVAKRCGVDVIDQIFNLGYGAALQSGYKYATDKNYDYILQMDADGQHDVSNLRKILDRLKGEIPPCGISAKNADPNRLPDIVIGSRFLEGAKRNTISWLKAIAIYGFRRAITISTGYHLTDPTSGLQGMNRKAFSTYAAYGNFDIQYPDLNMIIKMLLSGFHVEEIPAVMHDRTAGVSMHDNLLHAAKYMLVMTISTITIFNQNLINKHKK